MNTRTSNDGEPIGITMHSPEGKILSQLANVVGHPVTLERTVMKTMEASEQPVRGSAMLRRLIIGALLVLFAFRLVPSSAAVEPETQTGGKNPITASSADVSSDGSEQIIGVPALLQPIQGENEADKLKRIAQFIRDNKPQRFLPNKAGSQESQLAFCSQFLDDLLQMRNVEAIEPDFVSGPDDEIAWNEITDKLSLKHCEEVEHESFVPGDVNPRSYLRGSNGFNYASDIGGPPYRFYRIQLVPGKQAKYPVLYYNSREGGSSHTGFAVLDLAKCEITNEISANSEIPRSVPARRLPGASFIGIGRNILVKYKGQVLALLLAYRSASTVSSRYRLQLRGFGIQGSIGPECSWLYSTNPKALRLGR